MPLSVIAANAKANCINDAFGAIGERGSGATGMPPSKQNSEPFAWEFHVASHLARIAEARKKKAHANAVKNGIIFDHEKTPLAHGTNALIYAGDVVEISVTVTTPTQRLDTTALFAELVDKGLIKRVMIDRLIIKHTTENRAPHKFTSVLVTA